MRKILVLLALMLLSIVPLFAMGCEEEGVHYLLDDFGDMLDQFWRNYGHCKGTYKLSSGSTGSAGLHVMLNNFNKDVIFSLQDHTMYGASDYGHDYVSDNIVWSNGDCYLYNYWTGSVTVKIKFEDGSVKSYNAELVNDQITGTGAKKHVFIKNLYDDIVGKGNLMVSISNSNVSYTFREVSVDILQDYYLHLMGIWKISSTEVDSYKKGDSLSIWPGEHPSTVEKWGFITLSDTGDKVFYMTPGDSDNGPYYNYEFNAGYTTFTLKDISTGKKIILSK